MNTLRWLRSFRIFNIALFDLILGILGTVLALLVARYYYFPTLPMKPFVWAGVLTTIPLGVFTHILFGVNTTLNYKLGLSHKPN